ncbi:MULTISPECIES: hypothetical protein [Myxococcus]|nr:MULTISPECIES: hypothetical protein [Myxococcus]QPM81374.1 hypothetical protein I5Q59_08810 [Myxococcus xanthus]QVW70432.1 hypothetical protein JTM82_13105 [Myxococcus xanthus DZ2]QZZ49296.1 hypothetical protein MyxoNM_08800 [Myxococcus xanthus]UEO03439.1 hypothetical protein K1515_29710 [Myxococcus xanthus DZ2]UYI16389.1 hypothetical protein N3T43_08735 [Myxococcus xanthus]
MAFVLWLPVLVAVLTAPPAVPQVAPAHPSFPVWFDARVNEEQPKVFTRFQVDLDGDGRDDEVVCYGFMRKDIPQVMEAGLLILVGLASGERFAFNEGAGPDGLSACPMPPDKAEGSGKAVLIVERQGGGTSSRVKLRFDRKGPLLVGSVVNTRFSSNSMDLLTQRTHSSNYTAPMSDDENDEGDESESDGMAHGVSDLEATVLPSPGQVSWGQKHWKGPEDADLKVSLRRRGDLLVVSVRLRDDKMVTATDGSPKAILAADHLELSWTEWAATKSGTNQYVQLGVARNARGTPVATWFRPPWKKDTPLPTIRWTSPDAVEVDLRLRWLMPTPAKLGYYDPTSVTPQLKVSFSDGDGKGQETLVDVNAGMLFFAEPGRPFPTVEQYVQPWMRVADDATLRSLTL